MLLSPFRMSVPQPCLSSSRAMAAKAKGGKSAPVPEPTSVDELEDFDEGEFDPMDGLSAGVRRRVMALKELQDSYDANSRSYQQELAQLQSKYLQKCAPLFDERRDIVCGKKEVGTYDIPDDGETDEKCIPGFWATAFYQHDKVGGYITERDMDVLNSLIDVRAEVFTGEERGFKLYFEFADNKYFNNKTLEKSYILEPEEDVIPKRFEGCAIEWKDPSLDVTVELRKKRVKGGPKGQGNKSFTTESMPCDSFFNIFDPPQIPEDPEALDDEALQELQEELTADFDIGYSIKDSIIPRAVEWFTGEIASPMDEFDMDEDEMEEDYADMPGMKGGR